MHISMYICRYMYSQTYTSLYVYICFHVWVYIYMYLHIPVCIHVYQIFTTVSLYTYLICPWTNMFATLQMLVPLHVYCTAHISKIHDNCNFNLPLYCHICSSNKYAPETPQIYHMPKLLNVHQWGKYADIYATYEITGIDHVMRSAVM